MTQDANTGDYNVLIEGEVHSWNKDSITVPEIRELGGLPADCSVVQVDLQDDSKRTLAEDDVHHLDKLEAGKRVKKRVNFRRG